MGKIIYSDKSGTFVKLDIPDMEQALEGLGIDERGDVQKFLNRNAAMRMDKFVPFKTGRLRNTVDYTSDPTQITYAGPYARFQYMGYVMEDPETRSAWARRGVTKILRKPAQKLVYHGGERTGSRWDERMMAAEGDQLVQDVQDYIDRRRNNV